MCYLPMDVACRIKTVIAGKEVKQKAKEGHKVRKPMRPMGMSDYLIALAEKAVRKVTPSEAAKKWVKERYEKNLKARKIQDDKSRRAAKNLKTTKGK